MRKSYTISHTISHTISYTMFYNILYTNDIAYYIAYDIAYDILFYIVYDIVCLYDIIYDIQTLSYQLVWSVANATLGVLYETRRPYILAVGPRLHRVQHHHFLQEAKPILDLA